MPPLLTQLQVIHQINNSLHAASVRWWLFGGWGMDARIGQQTREHHDIEFWVAMEDADATYTALVRQGFTALDTQPPEESREFEYDQLHFSAAFFVKNEDGSAHPQGRWSDWHFPPGSFGDSPGRIGDLVVPAMSVEGMLAMKEQFATLRNGRPLRPKDIADIAVLRRLL